MPPPHHIRPVFVFDVLAAGDRVAGPAAAVGPAFRSLLLPHSVNFTIVASRALAS
jgi:hypothetical protein